MSVIGETDVVARWLVAGVLLINGANIAVMVGMARARKRYDRTRPRP